MRSSKEIEGEINTVSLELEALALHPEASIEQLEELKGQGDTLEAELSSAKRLEEIKAEVVAKAEASRKSASQPPVAVEISQKEKAEKLIPARVKNQRCKHFASPEDAYVSGMYFASLAGDSKANEILAAQEIGTDTKGGFTVPDPLSNALINLLEEYGVARQKCRRITMSSDTWTVPKVATHATVSYPSEAAAITETEIAFSQVQLVAKKIAALVKMSTEVTEDSIISIMDTVVQSIAYSIAIAEDENMFNGVASAINANGIAGDTGVADTNVTNAAALTLANLTAATVAIGNPIIGARNEWYLNSTLYHGQIRDLVNLAGGNTIVDLEGGQRPLLLGYPVNFVSVLPGAGSVTSGDLLAVFGDLSLGCYFGDRRALNFKVLNELYAENDQVGIQCTERVDEIVANPEVLAKITVT